MKTCYPLLHKMKNVNKINIIQTTGFWEN